MSSEFPRRGKGFCVKVVLKMTNDKGVGSFAGEFIPAKIKVFVISKESRYYDEQQALDHLSFMATEEEKQHWLSHVYGVKDKVAEDPYDQLMLNHSNDPNIRLFIKDYGDGYGYALRDIEEGEELTEDYRNYSFVQFLFRLMQEHE